MAHFKNYVDVKRLVLPSTKHLPEEEQAWIEMDVSPRKAGDYLFANSPIAGEITFAIILSRIKDWNYTELNGDPVPVTIDAIKLLDAEDFRFLQDQIIADEDRRMSAEEKKDLSDTSSSHVNVQVEDK